MAISPWYIGQTGPAWTPTLTYDSGAPIDLTGATGSSFSLMIHNTQSNQDVAGAGSWSIVNAPTGQAKYAWAAADVAEPGSYLLCVSVVLGGATVKLDPVPWLIKALP